MTPHIRLVHPTQLDSTDPILCLWYQETPSVKGGGEEMQRNQNLVPGQWA